MTTPTPPPPRPTSAVDALAEEYFTASVALSPVLATSLGVDGRHDEYDDFSPAGHQARADLRRATLSGLADTPARDDVDAVTLDAMRERLGLEEETYAAGLDEMALNVIYSPLQMIRDVLDLMPTQTEQEWATIAARLERIPTALRQWHESLRSAAARGLVSPVRQVREAAVQARDYAGDDGFFAALPARADAISPSATLSRALEAGAAAARAAYLETAQVLTDEFLPAAPERDACGPELYQLLSRSFLGTSIDLAETYEWGQHELAAITDEMRAVANDIKTGASIREAIALLDADPRYRLEGTEALQRWMQGQSDAAIAQLADTHFDIPAPIRRLECCIAPTHTGGIYYTGPSEDFTRPGRMWWSVPRGVETFTTWRELTTVFHEGVPGHHLQVAQTAYRRDTLNTWRRLMAWTSGHGEGWALYAERLMADLGFLDDPGNRMGMLDAQSLRAARVVLDIGVHCGFPAPAELGGGPWTYDKAWTFLTQHSTIEEKQLRFELNRYLGWPGQAPAYKVGERIWLALRDEARAAQAERFDLKAFHRTALDVGGVGLDTLRHALSRTP